MKRPMPSVKGYCEECRKKMDGYWEDCGIGSYEYWGAKGNDVRMVAFCSECEGQLTDLKLWEDEP